MAALNVKISHKADIHPDYTFIWDTKRNFYSLFRKWEYIENIPNTKKYTYIYVGDIEKLELQRSQSQRAQTIILRIFRRKSDPTPVTAKHK